MPMTATAPSTHLVCCLTVHASIQIDGDGETL